MTSFPSTEKHKYSTLRGEVPVKGIIGLFPYIKSDKLETEFASVPIFIHSD